MEFDEMKKIWDSQNNEPLYVINEKALHNRVLSKKKQAYHITNTSELLWIIVNICGGGVTLALNLLKQNDNVFIYLLPAWMLATALYILVIRRRRIKGTYRFDHSMRGDLDHAISVASYQVHLSRLGRWNILPMAILIILAIWDVGKSPWWIVGCVIFFSLVNYAAGWEHRIYKGKKHELDALKNKLENDEPVK